MAISISPISLAGFNSITPVNSLLSTLAATSQTSFGNNSSIVQLSGLGQLLSAISTFQNNLAALHPGATSSGLGQNFGSNFGSLAVEAQNFVDTFNSLQTSINNLLGTSGTLSGSSLAGPLVAALNRQAETGNSRSELSNLAQIGINFQAAAIPGDVGTLSIDLEALQSAFDRDPTGTFTILQQALDSFGNLAANFAGQAGSASAALGDIAQQEQLNFLMRLSGVTQSFSLFNSGPFGSGLSGVSNLFASSLLNPGASTTQAQQLASINHMLLISTLFG